jgi:hypothetical protein
MLRHEITNCYSHTAERTATLYVEPDYFREFVLSVGLTIEFTSVSTFLLYSKQTLKFNYFKGQTDTT